jgi:hypothetical protein
MRALLCCLAILCSVQGYEIQRWELMLNKTQMSEELLIALHNEY